MDDDRRPGPRARRRRPRVAVRPVRARRRRPDERQRQRPGPVRVARPDARDGRRPRPRPARSPAAGAIVPADPARASRRRRLTRQIPVSPGHRDEGDPRHRGPDAIGRGTVDRRSRVPLNPRPARGTAVIQEPIQPTITPPSGPRPTGAFGLRAGLVIALSSPSRSPSVAIALRRGTSRTGRSRSARRPPRGIGEARRQRRRRTGQGRQGRQARLKGNGGSTGPAAPSAARSRSSRSTARTSSLGDR